MAESCVSESVGGAGASMKSHNEPSSEVVVEACTGPARKGTKRIDFNSIGHQRGRRRESRGVREQVGSVDMSSVTQKDTSGLE